MLGSQESGKKVARLVNLIDLKGIVVKAGQLVNLNETTEPDEDVKLVDL